VIAIDTNILVRYLLRDEPAQTALARTFIDRELSEENPGFVAIVTIVELDWVCRRVYGITEAGVGDAIRKLLEIRQLVVEEAEMVEQALDRESGELADALIHAAGKAAGCSKTVTFDRRFARMHGVERLKR
jgi:predicted nucleic-acid-binding protein